jgi:PEP-CTERM motif
MKSTSLLGAAAAVAIVMGSSAGANAVTVTVVEQITPSDFGSTQIPTILAGNAVLRTGDAEPGAGWDPYGQSPGGPADTTHTWVDIPTTTNPVSSATYNFSGTSFEFVWGSPNPGNIVTFLNGATTVATVVTPDLFGVANTQGPGYLVDITGVPAFTSIVLSQGAGDGGNFELSVPAVPEPSTWAMMLIGFVGLGYARAEKDRSF